MIKMTICITLPSLAVIGQTISGIWRSCDFSKWRWLPSCIFEILIIGQEGQTVSMYNISYRSVKRMISYGDFSICQDGGHPILDVRNFKIVMVEKFKRAKLCHWPKFRADRSNGCGGMSIFYFQDRGRRHVGFSNFGTVGTLKRAKLCLRVKFRQVSQTAPEIWRF